MSSVDAAIPTLSIRRASRERAILRAARTLFTRDGFEETAILDIAQEVGVVEGTIYTYFDSKRALLHRIIAEFYEPLIAEAELALRGLSGARNKLRYLVWRQLRAFAEEPELCYLIIRELQPSAHRYDSEVVGLARRYTSLAIHVVEEGIAANELKRGVSPLLVRAMIYGTAENIAWRQSFRGSAMNIDSLADEVVDVLARGIAPCPTGAISAEAVADLAGEVRELVRRTRRSRAKATRTRETAP